MRGPALYWVLVILGLCIACGPCRAQDPNEQPIPAGTELQAESLFAEEIKQLESAGDKPARLAAFEALLKKSDDLERDPEPLVSVLQNKKPEATYRELLEYLRDNADARRECFLRPLVLNANDPGESAKIASASVIAYGSAGVAIVRELLDSEVPGERLAAANICGERVGGAAGVAKLIPALVKCFERTEPDLSGVVIKSLKRITLLEHDTPAAWVEWLGKKTEVELLAEIADRESDARRKAEADRARAEAELLAVLLERMRKDERSDANALITRLQQSVYLPVRLEAVKLLRELLPTQKEEAAQPIVDALGATLNNHLETEDVRKGCAIALAECGKPQLAFSYIDAALAANGISADLKLELVKGLNAPIAASRLAEMLKSEVDVVETRSGAVLDTLIAQVRSVVQVRDESVPKAAILGELSRLLLVITGKLGSELEAPARKRYIDLAANVCDTLGFIARQRVVDIAACVDSLLDFALLTFLPAESGAASRAMIALRQALDVPSTHPGVLEKLTSEPDSLRLGAQYAKLVGSGDEPMLVNLIGLYEAMCVPPEPMDDLRKRLMDRAASTEAIQPSGPDSRKTLREALRALIAVLIDKQTDRIEAHVALVRALMEADYGANDALGYLMVLKADRIQILTTALQPLVDKKPIKLGQLIARLDQSLNQTERESNDYKGFRVGVNAGVRTAIADRISRALGGTIDDDAKKELTGLASGSLRDQFVPTAVEQLRKAPAMGESRDMVSEILLMSLRQAHPNKYESVALKGLEKDAFVKALDDLNTKLRTDGYAVP